MGGQNLEDAMGGTQRCWVGGERMGTPLGGNSTDTGRGWGCWGDSVGMGGRGWGGCSQLVGERLCIIWGRLRRASWKGGPRGGSPGAPRPHTATHGTSQALRAPGGCGDPVGDLL